MNSLSRAVLAAGSSLFAATVLAQGAYQSPPAEEEETQTSQTQTPATPASQEQEGESTATEDSTIDSQSASADAKQPDRQAAAGQSSATALPVIMLLVPVAMERQTENTLANGCWAKLYGQEKYKGDTLTLLGPVDMSNMKGPFGVEWEGKVSSIKTGPRASVTIYDNVNYRDRAARIKPEQEVPELSEKMGFFEDFRSMRINCSPATG